jgi:hypothetical protein
VIGVVVAGLLRVMIALQQNLILCLLLMQLGLALKVSLAPKVSVLHQKSFLSEVGKTRSAPKVSGV